MCGKIRGIATSKTFHEKRAGTDIGRSAAPRQSKRGAFVVGQKEFAKMSAVEGIVVSLGLSADLERLGGVAHEKRCSALLQKEVSPAVPLSRNPAAVLASV